MIRLNSAFHNRRVTHTALRLAQTLLEMGVAIFRLCIVRCRCLHVHKGVCRVSLTCDDLGLSKDNLLRDATLSLVQLLTNAGDDTQTALQSVGRLLTNQLSA